MENPMGRKRRGGSRDSTTRASTRDGEAGRGTLENLRLRRPTGGDKPRGARESRGSGAQVKQLSKDPRRRRRGTGGTPRSAMRSPRTSTGNMAQTVGYRRLRMVLAAFVVTGLLLGGRAVQISITDGERYQAFAAERGVGAMPAAVEDRGDIVTADGRRLATSLRAARVIATPYQITEPAEAARALAGVIGPETGQNAAGIEPLLTERGTDGNQIGRAQV